MGFLSTSFLSALLGLLLLSCGKNNSAAQADLIFLGGDIITINVQNPRVEALALRGGKILDLGNKVDVLKHKGPRTRIINLEGKTLMPGLVDAHTHPIISSLMGETIDVSGFTNRNRAEIMARLKRAVDDSRAGKWILAYGWDPALLPDLKAPTIQELDSIAPENPVFIVAQTLHSAFVNTRAFEKAGITRDTPNPPGGSFEKDGAGELTGRLIEVGAVRQFRRVTPKFPPSAYVYLLTNQLEKYSRAGYTTVTAPGLQPLIPNHLAAARETATHPDSPLRLRVYPVLEVMKNLKDGPKVGHNKFRIMGVKLWIDGSPYAGGMASAEPYLQNNLTVKMLGIPAGSRGHLHFKDKELNSLVQEYHKRGFQISAHVQGERAVAQFLNAVDSALKSNPRKDHRHRMEHNALITRAQLERAHKLGVTVSFYLDHIYYYGDALHESVVGPERAARFMPVGSAKEVGHRFSLHTDTPSSPMGPFRVMAAAVMRKTRGKGRILGPSERLSVEDALKAMTIHAAWQIFEEKQRGSLEKGKDGDLIILSANPLKTPPEKWAEIKVEQTYLSGKAITYSSFSLRKLSLLSQTALGIVGGWFQ